MSLNTTTTKSVKINRYLRLSTIKINGQLYSTDSSKATPHTPKIKVKDLYYYLVTDVED